MNHVILLWRVSIACVITAIMAFCVDAAYAGQDDKPREPSFPIAAEATAFVARFNRTELVKDDVFIKVLVDLAQSDMSAEAKADAFALMQERIGWLFVGAARLFPNESYARTIAMILSTYVQYQQKMPADLKVEPLLDLARKTRGDHPLRASNALLLATILNHKASKESVMKAIDGHAIENATVPAIDLHNLSLAAALALDPTVVTKFVGLLPDIQSEESREDVIAATVIFQDDKLRGMIEQFVRQHFPALMDNSITTALIVLAHAGPQGHFRDFYKSLGDLTKDEKDIDWLRKFWDSGFRDPLQADPAKGSALKIWDGFAIKLENDGGTITDGKSFRYWISFK
jgi:hypothetical protein